MEPSRKCHAFELSLFLWRNAKVRQWKCGYTHSSRLQLSSICMPQSQTWCLTAHVPKFTILKSGMKAQVSFETTIEPRDLVYYLGHEHALHGRKTEVLPLDQRCLQNADVTHITLKHLLWYESLLRHLFWLEALKNLEIIAKWNSEI